MSALVRDSSGHVLQCINPNIPNIQTVSISGTSARTTNPVPGGCSLVMLYSTTDCFFNVGAAITAAADSTSIPLPAQTYFYVPVVERVDKIAFIQSSAAGTAWVIPAK